MITRALKLKRTIDRYCNEWQKPKDKDSVDLLKDFLNDKDWEELRHYQELLRPFQKATLRTEGRAINGSYGALWEVLLAFDYLFTKLSSAATEVENHEHLFTDHYRNCINAGFLKLKEYYGYSDQSRFYRAAVALHPTMRFHYFEAKWKHLEGGRDYIEGAKEAVQSLFEEYLANNPSTAPAAATPLLSHIARASSDDDEDYRTFFNFTLKTDIDQERQRKRQKQESELDRFITDEMELYYFERQMVNGQWKEVKLSYKDNPLA